MKQASSSRFWAIKRRTLVIHRAVSEMSFYSKTWLQQILRNLKKHGVKKIVTIDPHAYNIFKNEYPDFGFKAEVYHHTELLYELVNQGKLETEACGQ